MRSILGVNRRTNEKQSGTRKQNEDMIPRNNQYLASSVTMVLSGPGLLMMLKRILYNHSSFKKYQQVPPYDPIPGKLTLGSLAAQGYVHRLINHGKRQYCNGNGDHVEGLEGFLEYLKRSSSLKEVFVERDTSLFRGVQREIRSQKRKWYGQAKTNYQNTGTRRLVAVMILSPYFFPIP